MKPDIDKLDLHELRTRKDELQADMRAIWARISELEMIEAGLAKPATEPEPGPNAHPEGEDAP